MLAKYSVLLSGLSSCFVPSKENKAWLDETHRLALFSRRAGRVCSRVITVSVQVVHAADTLSITQMG